MGTTLMHRRKTQFAENSALLAPFFLACVVFASGCSAHGNQASSTPGPRPVPVPAAAPPTLTEIVPDLVTTGTSGKLVFRGSNFTPDTQIGTPPGLYLRNIQVDGPTQITADYGVSADSWLGVLNIRVTTPGGTSAPAPLKIMPGAQQFGLGPSAGLPEPPPSGPPSLESLQVGIHADQVSNPDGSQTDGYLNISVTDEKGHPVTVGDSWFSDMDNVDDPDDATDESGVTHTQVTSYSFSLEKPVPGKYVLRIKSSRGGAFGLETAVETSSPKGGSEQHGLSQLDKVPTYLGSVFELNFVCRRDPHTIDVDSGGLQPANGAFSFAQPVSSQVQLPAAEKALGVVIYYDPVMEPTSFHALLDGSDRTSLFHVRAGELELVSVPLEPGPHTLAIRANNKKGSPTEQEFHIQH